MSFKSKKGAHPLFEPVKIVHRAVRQSAHRFQHELHAVDLINQRSVDSLVEFGQKLDLIFKVYAKIVHDVFSPLLLEIKEKKLSKEWASQISKVPFKQLFVQLRGLAGFDVSNRSTEFEHLEDEIEKIVQQAIDVTADSAPAQALQKKISSPEQINNAIVKTLEAVTPEEGIAFYPILFRSNGVVAHIRIFYAIKHHVPSRNEVCLKILGECTSTDYAAAVAKCVNSLSKVPSTADIAAAASKHMTNSAAKNAQVMEDQVKSLLNRHTADDIVRAVRSQSAQGISASQGPASSPVDRRQSFTASDEMQANAMRLFQDADVDASGTIDEHELQVLLKKLFPSKNLSAPECNLIYQDMDEDHSGAITFDEFLRGYVKYGFHNREYSKQLEMKPKLKFEWSIAYDELDIPEGSKLGQGSYGVVYKAKWRGTTVAVKELLKKSNKNQDSLIEDFKQEVQILGRLRHPNVLLFMGVVIEDQHKMCIVTEFLQGGSVGDVIKQPNYTPTDSLLLRWAKETALGLNYLHLSKIIHRDLKPDNLMLDKHKNIKLCDFGLSAVKAKETVDAKHGVGTPMIWSPELLARADPRKFQYNEKTDVYAYALTVWCMFGIDFFDDKSFRGVSTLDQLKKAVVDKKARPHIPKFVPKDFSFVIQQCWEADPDRRYDCAQIIALLERVQRNMMDKYYS